MELCHAETRKGQNQIQSHYANEIAGKLIGYIIHNLGSNVALRDFGYCQI